MRGACVPVFAAVSGLLWAVPAATARARWVEATGAAELAEGDEAAALASAVAEAERVAVRETARALLGEDVGEDRIARVERGFASFVRGYRILRRRLVGRRLQVTLSVDVDRRALARALGVATVSQKDRAVRRVRPGPGCGDAPPGVLVPVAGPKGGDAGTVGRLTCEDLGPVAAAGVYVVRLRLVPAAWTGQGDGPEVVGTGRTRTAAWDAAVHGLAEEAALGAPPVRGARVEFVVRVPTRTAVRVLRRAAEELGVAVPQVVHVAPGGHLSAVFGANVPLADVARVLGASGSLGGPGSSIRVDPVRVVVYVAR